MQSLHVFSMGTAPTTMLMNTNHWLSWSWNHIRLSFISLQSCHDLYLLATYGSELHATAKSQLSAQPGWTNEAKVMHSIYFFSIYITDKLQYCVDYMQTIINILIISTSSVLDGLAIYVWCKWTTVDEIVVLQVSTNLMPTHLMGKVVRNYLMHSFLVPNCNMCVYRVVLYCTWWMSSLSEL